MVKSEGMSFAVEGVGEESGTMAWEEPGGAGRT